MNITMKNPKTGEIKQIKVGVSWILFLFSGLFGLPLFLRKLHVWGGIFLALWVVNLVAPAAFPNDQGIGIVIILFFVFLGLQIFVGIKGNEMTAKNYLENGWLFLEPDAEPTIMAKRKWGIDI